MPIEVTCTTCGKRILKKPYQIKRAKLHFCSVECHLRFVRNQIQVKCEFCGKSFKKHASQANKNGNNFCTRACFLKWRKQESLKLVCGMCGMPFERQPHEVKRNSNVFCSRACFGKWMSENECGENNKGWKGGGIPNVEVICKNCKIVYKVYPSQIRKGGGIFCSNKCQGEWASKNIIGEKVHSWKGGISYEPYCEKFNNVFKESIRDKFYRTCFLCGRSESEIMEIQKSNGKRQFRLSVHHTNYDKKCLCENVKCKFVPLCVSCHAKTNHNREYHESIIINKLNKMNI